MVKSVLCFGDSLTWGSNAETGGRHSHDDLWPSVLQKALGSDVHVIHEVWAVAPPLMTTTPAIATAMAQGFADAAA